MNARVVESLKRALDRHRLVFWYDPAGEWAAEFEGFDDPAVTRLRVAGTEFGAKVQIHRGGRDARYLLYLPSPRPPDPDNWLLDLLMQGFEFKADKVSLVLQELGLPYTFRPLIEAHQAFFNSAPRVEALRALLGSNDEKQDIELKMIAVLAGGEPEIDDLLRHFLDARGEGPLFDPVEGKLGPAALAGAFWDAVGRAFGYASPAPTIRDFATTLFRSADPLDVGAALSPHAKVFIQQWQDSAKHRAAFRAWSEELEAQLRVRDRLDPLSDPAKLGTSDTFAAFEQWVIAWLRNAFVAGAPIARLRDVLANRRRSFWRDEHADGYAAIAQAISLREALEAVELSVPSFEAGIGRYAERWHPIDTAYRKFCHHQRRYNQPAVLQPIADWVEGHYVNNFLLPLADRWGDQVRALPTWRSARYPAQTEFFTRYVRPFLAKSQKVIVIVSDALRYEAAAELAGLLRGENRWTAELDIALGVLPSYTQLGMAALLPGDARAIDLAGGTVLLDAKPSAGTSARNAILGGIPGARGVAIQAEDFMQMATKKEARDLIKDNDVVYIFHNVIDKVGDVAFTEAKTAEAVEDALDELLKILMKAHSANAYNMIVTADHGFLFQQSDTARGDDQALPAAGEWLFKNRRFALGRGIAPNPAVKVFSAAQLGLEGDWQAAFPLGLGRFPLQGSGKRYVHGGPSLQEIVLPVLRIHKTRADDTGQVEVELLRPPNRITTGRVSLALYQEQPVTDKMLGRKLRIGVYAPNGTALSEVRELTFDSADPEPRQREKALTLTLSHASDDYNDQDVEIRLEQALPGTAQFVTYKTHRVALKKRFDTDFDD